MASKKLRTQRRHRKLKHEQLRKEWIRQQSQILERELKVIASLPAGHYYTRY